MQVGYCQGMNFVAGTILLFVRNPVSVSQGAAAQHSAAQGGEGDKPSQKLKPWLGEAS